MAFSGEKLPPEDEWPAACSSPLSLPTPAGGAAAQKDAPGVEEPLIGQAEARTFLDTIRRELNAEMPQARLERAITLLRLTTAAGVLVASGHEPGHFGVSDTQSPLLAERFGPG